DYDFGLRVAVLRELFGRLAEALPPLAEERAAQGGPADLVIPVDAQRAAVAGTLRRVGVDERSWRVDTSPHPFTTWVGRGDTRLTTRYENQPLESVLAALH